MCEHWANGVSPWPRCKDCRVDPLPEPAWQGPAVWSQWSGIIEGGSPPAQVPDEWPYGLRAWGKDYALDVLSAVFGKHAEAAVKQCWKLARARHYLRSLSRQQEYVSIACLWALAHSGQLTAMTAKQVSRAVANAIHDAERMDCVTRMTRMHDRDGKWQNDLDYYLLSTLAEDDGNSLFEYLTADIAEREGYSDPAETVGIEQPIVIDRRRYNAWQADQEMTRAEPEAYLAWEMVHLRRRDYRYVAKVTGMSLSGVYGAVQRVQAKLEAILRDMARTSPALRRRPGESFGTGARWYGSREYCLPGLR